MDMHFVDAKYCTILLAEIYKSSKVRIIEHAPIGLLCLVSVQVIYSCIEGQSGFLTHIRSLQLLKGLTNASGTTASLKINTEAEIQESFEKH